MFSRSAIKNQNSPSTPPLRFPQKLWKIANECTSGAVSWSPHGKSILLRYSLFKEEFMATKSDFFKTDNISSFVRQLNLYGFRKVYDHTHKQVYRNHPDLHEFSNSHFQREMPELLEKVTRKSGILKERNDFLMDNQQFSELAIDSPSDNKYDAKVNVVDENGVEKSVENNISLLQPPSMEENVIEAPFITTEVPQAVQVQPSIALKEQPPAKVRLEKKKRGRKPGTKKDPFRPKRIRFSKLKPKQQMWHCATLKKPELFPNLMYYDDEDKSAFLRHTSRDVMLSSTLPFQESPELKELKETYHNLYAPRVRIRYSSLPLNIPCSNKAPVDGKQQKNFMLL